LFYQSRKIYPLIKNNEIQILVEAAMKKTHLFVCICLVVFAASLGGAWGIAGDNASDDDMKWNGVYITNMKDGGENGVWASADNLSVNWGQSVKYNDQQIESAKFNNDSSISWNGDPIVGNGQIWFTSGDNRSFYWPEGAVLGNVFTGKIETISGNIIGFKGLNDTRNWNDKEDQIKCTGASCATKTNPCGPCSNGKVCSNGQCICPGGTTDCFGQCLPSNPCNGNCANGKVCSNNQCVCPTGTKECNDQCISVTECCGGCPPWKVCNKGKCDCPLGVTNCPDPLPL
jgi:hypothetical protein